MRILLTVNPVMPVPPTTYGGVERIVGGLVAELQRRGHTVGLIAHRDSTAAAAYFSPFPSEWPTNLRGFLDNTIALQHDIQAFRPDIVHSFSRLLFLLPSLWRRLPKVHSYGLIPGGRQIRLAARLAGASLAFTGCSQFIADIGQRHGGRWQAIPNFIDVDTLHFSPKVSADAPLLFLSRVESIKGPHVAIEIARRTGRRLIIAGNHQESGVEGEYWRTRIVPQLGRDGIDYVGPVDNAAKNRLLGAAASLIVPVQWDEPFGIVFAEALACGTPVISCARGALPEIVRHGVDGFLITDVEEGCRAVAALATIDRAGCRGRAEQCFSTAAIVPRYEALYQAMAGRN